jgi:hypothetical protein
VKPIVAQVLIPAMGSTARGWGQANSSRRQLKEQAKESAKTQTKYVTVSKNI